MNLVDRDPHNFDVQIASEGALMGLNRVGLVQSTHLLVNLDNKLLGIWIIAWLA